MNMQRILIIEDDPAITLGLQSSLHDEHYEVLACEDGQEGYDSALGGSFDLIILDLMLPGKHGQDICTDLRKAGKTTPILMLTSRSEEMDKIIGLELGADDYVTKPFSLRELLARIKAILRRTVVQAVATDELQFDDIVIHFKKGEASKDGRPLKLSVKELRILKYLSEHEGEIITRDRLLDDIWGYETYPTTRTVDNYILSLRKAIEGDPSRPVHILTVHTAGYKFIR
jgi:DNA-binding response OmpR family regulator